MSVKQKRVIHLLIFILVLLGTIYFLYALREIVSSFFIAVVLAYLLFRPVRKIEKMGVKRSYAILFLYVFIISAISLTSWFAIPRMIGELSDIANMLPSYAQQAEDIVDQIEEIELPMNLHQVLQDNLISVKNYIYLGLANFIAHWFTFLGKIIAIIFSPILAFYIICDWEKIRDAFLKLLTPKQRRDVFLLASDIDKVLVEFIKGHLMVAALVGIMVGIAATLLGVPFAFLIAIIAGVSDLVPFFGPILGGIPAVGLAMTESLETGAYMALAILVIQQVESNLITPKIIGDRLGLHPLLIVFALLAGAKLLGIWGMIFAVPVVASLKVILIFAYLRLIER